jgi:uncharacterized protein
MKPSIALETHRIDIRRIVEAHCATNARVSGSAAAGADSRHSDIDILVDPTPDTTLLDICSIKAELAELLGVPV